MQLKKKEKNEETESHTRNGFFAQNSKLEKLHGTYCNGYNKY